MSTILASARPKHAFKIAFDQLKPYRLRLLGVLVLGLVTAICGLIGPWAVGVVVDKLLITPDFRQVLGYCLLIVVGGIIAALGTWWGNVLLARVLEPAIANLRESVLDAALTLDSDTVERAGRGDLVSRVADDSREVSSAASSVTPMVIQAGKEVPCNPISSTFSMLDSRSPVIAASARVALKATRPMSTTNQPATITPMSALVFSVIKELL